MRWWLKWFLASVVYSGIWLSIGLKIYESVTFPEPCATMAPMPWEYFQLQVVLGFMGWMLLGIIIYLEAIKYDLEARLREVNKTG